MYENKEYEYRSYHFVINRVVLDKAFKITVYKNRHFVASSTKYKTYFCTMESAYKGAKDCIDQIIGD